MIALIKKLYANDVIRYIFFGGCTTVVNLASFFFLRQAGLQREIANVISVILAIVFAYVVNSKFVFLDKCETLKDHIRPFCKFVGARLSTMVIEVGGVWFFGWKTDHPVCSYGFKLCIQQIPGIYQWEEMMTLEEARKKIKPLDEEKMETARKRWDSIAKPLHSLGKMEDLITQIVGITGEVKVDIGKKALVAMCADNGVVEEGVTQTGQEVTGIVADNFVKETTTACVMCHQCGVAVKPVDVGMVKDTTARTDLKVMYGTRNMTKGPAMTREEAVKGIEAGIAMAEELKAQGYRLLATGEMGIGNTTTSSAVASVLLDQPVETMTGRGAGLSSDGLTRKINAIKKAIALNEPDPSDPIDVLAKVGGLDIAGMAGVYLGGAALQIPVLIDGFISGVAALVAAGICPQAKDYMIASHVSKEPAAHLVLEKLGKEAVLHADMCLGEGTGAIALCPFLDMGATLYNTLSTFDDIHVDQYEELK